ncbi:MAG: TetR/AcrR family transcriptional regulator, partial [Proteobacteria bacterium]
GYDSILGGGIQGFTANELMRRTSLSKGALFHHFSSLNEIAIECVNKGDRILGVELKDDLRSTLEHMMQSTHGHRRMRALSSLLYFYCEKARDDSRFKKPHNYLNMLRQHNLTAMLTGFQPKAKPEALANTVRYLHIMQLGLASPTGDCLSLPDRLKCWDQAIDHALLLLQQK